MLRFGGLGGCYVLIVVETLLDYKLTLKEACFIIGRE